MKWDDGVAIKDGGRVWFTDDGEWSISRTSPKSGMPLFIVWHCGVAVASYNTLHAAKADIKTSLSRVPAKDLS